MKKSEAILRISKKLQKQTALLKGYSRGVINLKCLCDNLATYVINDIEKAGMLPPPIKGKCKVEVAENGGLVIPIWGWEPEFEETKNEQK